MRLVGKKSLRLLTVLYVLLLTTVSLLPSGARAPLGWDQSVTTPQQKALHVLAYAGFPILVTLSLRGEGRISLRTVLLAGLACWMYGGLLEFAQTFVPGRTGSVADALLNGAGVAAGLAALALIQVIRGPRRFPAPPWRRGFPGRQTREAE